MVLSRDEIMKGISCLEWMGRQTGEDNIVTHTRGQRERMRKWNEEKSLSIALKFKFPLAPKWGGEWPRGMRQNGDRTGERVKHTNGFSPQVSKLQHVWQRTSSWDDQVVVMTETETIDRVESSPSHLLLGPTRQMFNFSSHAKSWEKF